MVLFGMWTHVGPRNHEYYGGSDLRSPIGRGDLGMLMARHGYTDRYSQGAARADAAANVDKTNDNTMLL